MTNAIITTNDPITECREALACSPPAVICGRRAIERARRELQTLERDVGALPEARRAPYEAMVSELRGELYWLEARVSAAEDRASPATSAATEVISTPRRAPLFANAPPDVTSPSPDRGTRPLPPSRRLPADRDADRVVAGPRTMIVAPKGGRR